MQFKTDIILNYKNYQKDYKYWFTIRMFDKQLTLTGC